jgi:hypothetical protein
MTQNPVRSIPDVRIEHLFDTLARWGAWHDPDLGRPIAAPLERCAQLLGVDLATVGKLAAQVEPYLRADGTRIWNLMQLERQLRPEAYRRRRGGYLDRRQAPAADAAAAIQATVGSIHGQVNVIAGPPPWIRHSVANLIGGGRGHGAPQ